MNWDQIGWGLAVLGAHLVYWNVVPPRYPPPWRWRRAGRVAEATGKNGDR
ncbi:MAG TPA: hypothetical protein VK586_03550 [Streptosporangiaceae bacterium]|nr:hypothetical protein [Streptosporangiaceae bacterium]